ncbi:glycosyltransferase family 4 protein [Thermosediminibacter litoriperuensis]|uniref:Glycosyltransferase involved in cell wall biosynthesis n=1 Tax=Thermosediminibacter litoriperuensis TaxID=291989 RepID=A0A5S5AY98_9FIRM|nr:glycosyltransferase family 4 protein [Thermosediminibacter litoriperuensis]TYP57820.1 glycosyltransferase involved in cell wall biosynthesis [Thermosediminibacter litoriperuensis]
MEQLTVLLVLMALDTGGAETHVVSLARQLKKEGVRVLVASRGGKLTKELTASGIEHFTFPLDSKTPRSLLVSVRGLTKLVREYGVDLIHAHARIPAWVSQWVSYFTGCPYITTSHGIYSTSWGMGFLTAWGSKIIAVSEDVKEHLIKNFKVKPERIYVIPNGIDLDKFDPGVDTSEIQKELGLEPQDLKIVYVSRLMGARGEIALRLIEAMPEIASSYQGVKLLVVGEGDKLEAIKEQAEGCNRALNGRRVIVTGARLDTHTLMGLADVAVGVGRVALEAMALKKPVIIAGEAGFMGVLTPENFNSGMKHNFSGRGSAEKTGSVNLAASIKRLLASPDWRRELGEFGRRAVEEYFSIKSMTRRVMDVYRKVLEEVK